MNINELIAAGEYEEAAAILYSGILYIINNYIPNVQLNRDEWDAVAPYLIEKMQDPIVEPGEPTEDPGDDIVISKTTGTLTITFEGPEGLKLPPDYVKEVRIGGTYVYYPITFDGYVADQDVVTGTMTEDGVEVTVTYEAQEEPVVTHTLTIHYVGPDGDEGFVIPSDTYTADLEEGDNFSITSPVVEGYVADKAVVSGTMGTENIEETVTYTARDSYTLTINYLGPEGDEEFEIDPELYPDVVDSKYVQEFYDGESYSVDSPIVDGYTCDKEVVSGTITEDTEVSVQYAKEE